MVFKYLKADVGLQLGLQLLLNRWSYAAGVSAVRKIANSAGEIKERAEELSLILAASPSFLGASSALVGVAAERWFGSPPQRRLVY